MFEKISSFQLSSLQLPAVQLATIQLPAAAAGASLIIEGLLAGHPIGAIFQLLPILLSAGAAYYAWIGGYYFVACLYALGGILAILAFSSIRFLVNIPAVALFVLILFLPGLREGPQRDLFAMMQFPSELALFSLLMFISALILVQRLNYPRLYMVALGAAAVSFAATLFIMFDNFHWSALQRTLSVGAGSLTLLFGYYYYKFSAVRNAGEFATLEDARADEEVRDAYRAELRNLLLELEEIRKEQHLRPRWLHSACVEAGVVAMYDELIAAGEVEFDPNASAGRSHGPRAPVRGDGIKSDPYEILGLRPGASLEEIKEAYRKHIRVYDPKKLADLSPDVRKVFTKMSDAVTRAYGALTKT